MEWFEEIEDEMLRKSTCGKVPGPPPDPLPTEYVEVLWQPGGGLEYTECRSDAMKRSYILKTLVKKSYRDSIA